MNYELATKLDEVGWKYYGNGEWINKDGFTVPEGSNEAEIAYVPTLSELIEACGKEFDDLERWRDMWYVTGGKFYKDFAIKGKTPEEAVANLYLELNKK